MEKALTKVGSLKVGGLWISKKAREEFSNITEDLTVSKVFGFRFVLNIVLVFLIHGLCNVGGYKDTLLLVFCRWFGIADEM